MLELPSTIYVAIGATLAAFITGLFTFTSILIAKDQKTSEFRQEWINRVRDEITKFIYSVGDFTSHLVAKKADENAINKFIDDNLALTNEILRSYNSIRLHLNKKENKEIIDVLDSLYDFAQRSEINYSVEDVSEVEERLISLCQEMLKKEWTRVKKGEISYRISKWLGSILILTSTLSGIYFIPEAISMLTD